MKIALAQLNTTIGDFDGNLSQIRDAMARADADGADLLVCPELSVCGYPPQDLLERSDFCRDAMAATEALAIETDGRRLQVLVGLPLRRALAQSGVGLYNGAALLAGGTIRQTFQKTLLPTYDVFDEARYFDVPSTDVIEPVEIAGIRVGVTICEDIWNDASFWPRRRYHRDPVEQLVRKGARAIINLSASPYHVSKTGLRVDMLASLCRHHGVPLAYCNLAGANDELIFEGGSMVLDARGRIISAARRFETDYLSAPLLAAGDEICHDIDDIDDIGRALVLGVRDYCGKCGFSDVVVGLSGGIDSAVTAAIAVRALGADHVVGIGMPSRYSSEGSVVDARALAKNLGIRFEVVPIEAMFAGALSGLSELFTGTEPDVAEENIQARLRGMVLMAYSNKFGALLLTTGNKSELAVGYCTLYGDMNGGLAVISDLPKNRVYALGRHFNRDGEVIPESTLTKPPSAELRPDQTDQDSLPPYDVLDDILEWYVERGADVATIVGRGHDESTVRDVVRLVDRNEYKRRQAAIGLRVTSKAFGVGRRRPLAQRFRP